MTTRLDNVRCGQLSDPALANRLDTRHATLDNQCSPRDTRHSILGLETQSSDTTLTHHSSRATVGLNTR
eukprot:2578727-Rhodomonas_salina.1